MPGITGYWGAPDLDILSLARALRHREPQSIRILLDRQGRAVAHVGLRVPAPPPSQPEEGRISIAVAGEILGGLGRTNPNPNDGESFLMSLYLEDPSLAFTSSLDGVFAAAIFDEARQRLVLLTDPLGLEPLYFRAESGRIVFSSEIRIFAEKGLGGAEINPRAVGQFLRRGHLTSNTTWIRSVDLLGPGGLATFDGRTGQVILDEEVAPVREPGYGSYDEAREAVSAALRSAIRRLAGERCAIELGGDVSSRLILAEAQASGRRCTAFTYGGVDSEDYVYARKVCAVRNTPSHCLSRVPADWFQRQTAAIWLGEGAHPVNDATLEAASLMSHRGVDAALCGHLGNGLLGPGSIKGYADERLEALRSRRRRAFHASVRPAQNFVQARFPFAARDLVAACLRSDTSYVLDGRLLADLSLRGYAPYFSTIPVRGTGGRTAAQILSGSAPEPSKTLPPSPHDLDALLRTDPRIEETLRGLLFGADALYRSFADAHAAQALFFDFFRHGDLAARDPILRHAWLEIWLRQLLRGELREPGPFSDAKLSLQRSKRPKISVIVPAFNAEPFLGECLNSLMNQTLPEFEVLVVNDGSTDGTQAVVDEFAGVDPRIRPLTTANEGVYAARNRALDVAEGDLVSFVDADDYLHPEMFEALYTALVAHDADLSFCDVYEFDPTDAMRVRQNTLQFEADAPFDLASAPQAIGDGFSALWNRLYRRSFLEEHGLRFDAQHRISADMLFLQRVLRHTRAMVRVPRALYYHRLTTPSGLTSYEVRNARYLTHLAINIEVMDFWVREGLFDRYAPHVITKGMKNFLWNTHIDEENLRVVFDRLHAYVQSLDVGPAVLRQVPTRERKLFELIRNGSFAAFMRSFGAYRAGMVQKKGGSLSRREQISLSAAEMKRALTRQRVKLRNDRTHGKYKLSVAGFEIAVDHPRVALMERLSQSPLAVRTGRALRELEHRARLAANLRAALRFGKPDAELTVLHFSVAFSVPSETFTYDVLRGLESRPEVDNYMVCLRRELETERPYPKTICLQGQSRSALHEGSPDMERALDQVFSSIRPHLVHCHFGWMGIPLVRMMRKLETPPPIVITMHGTDVNMWPNRFWWYRDTLHEIAGHPWVSFTTHTETYRRKLVALGVPEARVEVIPNSFHADFAPPDARFRMRFERGGVFRVVSVARMDIWKGHEHLIRGFAKFQRESYPNSTLTLVGYGPEEPALRELVKALGMEEHVRFRGRLAHHNVPQLLRTHHVYVQPSIKHAETLQEEGQPIAVLEAISSGLLVVVTDTGGMAETVQVGPHENQAFVIPAGSDDAIAKALGRALKCAASGPVDPAYVAAIAERHSQEGQIDRTLAHYRTVRRAHGNGRVHGFDRFLRRTST